MNKILNWLVVSSADSSRVSLTLQGILLADAGMVINNLSSLGINISNTQYVADATIACTVLGALLGTIGLVRKVVLSVKGQVTPQADKQPLLG